MITLYGIPGSASLAPHILLEEAGAGHEFVVPTRDGPDAGPPEFLTASPHRKVPAMVDGEVTLTEAAAICMHIADRHQERLLGPPQGDPGRSDWYRWLVYLSNTPQPALYQYIYPERYTTAADQVDATRQLADAKLGAIWDWVDTQLDDREFLMPGTICRRQSPVRFPGRRMARSDVGRHRAPPRGVGMPSRLSVSQIAWSVRPRSRICLMRSARSGGVEDGRPARRDTGASSCTRRASTSARRTRLRGVHRAASARTAPTVAP